jgi:TolA-binding protein
LLLYVLCLVAASLSAPSAARGARARDSFRPGDEIQLSSEEYKKLDRLEAHALDKADAIFREGKFRQATAEYETFLREYPRSIALPYVLLRKARCLHLDDKRNEAARQYDEVVDYFPNEVEYAAAALYYQGKAHWDSGDEALALKSWARMANDKQYRTHRLAAGAINQLADQLVAQGQAEAAAAYFEQVAIDFRGTNRIAAEHARPRVTLHYVRTSPNEAKLRKFFADARVIRSGRQVTDAELAKDPEYWQTVLSTVRQLGHFKSDQAELRKPYFEYWLKALDGKFLQDDDYQIDLAGLVRDGLGDSAGWASRLDAQFARGKTDDCSRVIRWMREFGPIKAKTAEYYAKLDFGKMTTGQIVALVRALYDDVAEPNMAAGALRQLNLSKMTDGEKFGLARYLWHKGNEEWIKRLCEQASDAEQKKHELLCYWHWRHRSKEGLPFAEELLKSERYSADAMWKKAEFLEWDKKYPEAIGVYRQTTSEPENFWRIAGCYEKMGKIDQAIKQLREIESFFKEHRSQAAIRVAQVYKRAGQKEQCIAAFRQVLVKYPESPESSTAHEELERMGITRIKGGVGEGKPD